MMMGLKRSFTLLEMMIALVILSIIGALIVLQVKKLVDVHRFEGNVADLFIALQEAQALSATYQTDIALDIFLEKGIPTYRFTTDEPFPPNQFKQQPVALGNTSRVEFNGTKATALHLLPSNT
jgi:prepilin-type N-terminal cleavage/methylation domain-containing protein